MKNKIETTYIDGRVEGKLSINENGKRHGACRWFNQFGRLSYEEMNINGELHGPARSFGLFGIIIKTKYWIYGEKVSEKEYRRFKLIEKLSGLGEQDG